MSQTPEHRIMNQIMLECGRRNWMCYHCNVGGGKLANGQWFTTGLPNGFPDLLILKDNGSVLFCECKAKGGRLREDQKKFHEQLKSRGHNVIVCYSLDEFIAKCDLRA